MPKANKEPKEQKTEVQAQPEDKLEESKAQVQREEKSEAPQEEVPREEDESLEKKVTTPNGVEKTVVGSDKDEVKEAVEAAEAEEKVVPLDINDPKHGNLTDAERQKL